MLVWAAARQWESADTGWLVFLFSSVPLKDEGAWALCWSWRRVDELLLSGRRVDVLLSG